MLLMANIENPYYTMSWPGKPDWKANNNVDLALFFCKWAAGHSHRNANAILFPRAKVIKIQENQEYTLEI